MVKKDKEQKNTSPPAAPSLARKSIKAMAKNKLYPNIEDELGNDNNHEQNGDGEDLSDEGYGNDESESREVEDKNSLKKEEVKDSHFWCNAIASVLCIIIAILMGLLYAYVVNRTESSVDQQSLPVTDIVKFLKKEFNKQPELLFKSVKSCLSTLNDKSATEPCILLFFVDPNSNAVEKFKKEFAQIINIHPILIDGSYIVNRDSDKTKLEIDNILKDKLSKSKLNFVIVNSLDKIPGQAALMFHSYCDHENAPFQNVIYMFFVTSNVHVPASIQIKALDGMASKQIRTAWVDLNTDQLEPLLTRLTVRVVPMV